uniref:Uncharacterized protein n=1 Tax=Glossina pallidipes TaxID=7398 RepID=A0A1A9ZKB0_GLOPL
MEQRWNRRKRSTLKAKSRDRFSSYTLCYLKYNRLVLLYERIFDTQYNQRGNHLSIIYFSCLTGVRLCMHQSKEASQSPKHLQFNGIRKTLLKGEVKAVCASGGWEIVMMKVNRTTTFIERKVSNKDMKIAAVTTFTTLLYAFVTVDDCICVLHPIKTSIKKSFKTNGNDGSLNVPSTGNLCPKRLFRAFMYENSTNKNFYLRNSEKEGTGRHGRTYSIHIADTGELVRAGNVLHVVSAFIIQQPQPQNKRMNVPLMVAKANAQPTRQTRSQSFLLLHTSHHEEDEN